jgi:hypothetical protein
MAQKKEFGKLSADQIRQLVALLPTFEALRNEFMDDIKGKPWVGEAIDEGVWWAPLYELSMEQHLGLLFKATGLDKAVQEAVKSEDPASEILKLWKDDSVLGQIEPVEGFKPFHAINIAMSLERSLDSLVVWGRYLNELVAAVREGDDESLFKAVRIDPSVVSCPSVAMRISKATVLGDKKFLRALGRALEGRTQRQARYLRAVRLAIQALREAGVESISDEQLRDLFLKKPEIYKAPPSASPEKALRKHFHASKRKSTT